MKLVLLCFFDVKPYLKKNEQEQKEENAPKCINENLKIIKLMN